MDSGLSPKPGKAKKNGVHAVNGNGVHKNGVNGNGVHKNEVNGKAKNGKVVSFKIDSLTGIEGRWSKFWAIGSLSVFPLALLVIQVSCSKGSCSVSEIPPLPTDFSSYFNLDAFFAYSVWLAFQLFLYVLPIGSKVQRKLANGKVVSYRLNGTLACVLTYVTLFWTAYNGYSYEIVTKNLLSLHVISIAFSLTLALYLHFKTSTSKDKRMFLLRFANGSDSSPQLWVFDLKRFLIRSSLLTWAGIMFAVQATENMSPRSLNSSNTLVTIIQLFLAAETICLEESTLASYLVRHDKVGFQFIYGCLVAVPLLFSFTIRYTADQILPMSEFAVISRFFLCVPGYCLYRGAMSDKTLFTSDPEVEDFNKSCVLRDEQGSAILADGFWAYSRNPNYLGLVILAATWLSPGYDGIFKTAGVLIAVAYLINRSFTVDQINQRLHGKMWTVYCQKVKSRILKNVF